jgi:hypothetical protein
VGFGKRVMRKSVRRVTPRSVQKAASPVRTVKNAVTPRGVKRASRALYPIKHPIGAAQNALIDTALNPGRGRANSSAGSTRLATPSTPAPLQGEPAAVRAPTKTQLRDQAVADLTWLLKQPHFDTTELEESVPALGKLRGDGEFGAAAETVLRTYVRREGNTKAVVEHFADFTSSVRRDLEAAHRRLEAEESRRAIQARLDKARHKAEALAPSPPPNDQAEPSQIVNNPDVTAPSAEGRLERWWHHGFRASPPLWQALVWVLAAPVPTAAFAATRRGIWRLVLWAGAVLLALSLWPVYLVSATGLGVIAIIRTRQRARSLH